MDVEVTNPIHHLIFGGGIVHGCTVLCVVGMHGHRWDKDKRGCFFSVLSSMFVPLATTLIFSFILRCLHEEDTSSTNVSPSTANVSSWSGGIAFFLSVAFRQSLKRFNCPPVDVRPSFSSPYSTRHGSRFSGIRMTCPVHLSWRSAMMASIERQWAR